MNVTALAYLCRHKSDDIAYTGTAFKYVAALETHCLGNIPKCINNRCRCEIGTVAAHIGSIVAFGS